MNTNLGWGVERYTPKVIGKKLTELRTVTKLSQKTFLNKIGMDHSFYVQVQLGKAHLTKNHRNKIIKLIEEEMEKEKDIEAIYEKFTDYRSEFSDNSHNMDFLY